MGEFDFARAQTGIELRGTVTRWGGGVADCRVIRGQHRGIDGGEQGSGDEGGACVAQNAGQQSYFTAGLAYGIAARVRQRPAPGAISGSLALLRKVFAEFAHLRRDYERAVTLIRILREVFLVIIFGDIE